MRTAPTLHTERLRLRSFKFEDAQDVQRLAGDRDIAMGYGMLKVDFDAKAVKEPL